jgi:hypothetical protein
MGGASLNAEILPLELDGNAPQGLFFRDSWQELLQSEWFYVMLLSRLVTMDMLQPIELAPRARFPQGQGFISSENIPSF